MTSLHPCPRCGFVPILPKPEGNSTIDTNGNPVLYVGVIVCSCRPLTEVLESGEVTR